MLSSSPSISTSPEIVFFRRNQSSRGVKEKAQLLQTVEKLNNVFDAVRRVFVAHGKTSS